MEKHAQIELSGNTTFIRGLVKSSKVNSVYFVLVAKTRKLSQIKLKNNPNPDLLSGYLWPH